MSRSFHNESRFDRAPRLIRYTSAQTEIADALVEIAYDPSVARLPVVNDTDAWVAGPAWLDDCLDDCNDRNREPIAYTSETPRNAQVSARPVEGTRVRTHVQHLQPRERRLPQPTGLLHSTNECWREQTSRRTGSSVCR